MDLLWNILDRWVIHFFASTSLVLLVFFSLSWVKKRSDWFYYNWMYVMAGLIVFACSATREAYDVWCGQPLIKAFTDYSSWLLGSGVSAWGLYRYKKWRDK